MTRLLLPFVCLCACNPDKPSDSGSSPTSSQDATWIDVALLDYPEHWSGYVSVGLSSDVGEPRTQYSASARFAQPGPKGALRSQAVIEDPLEGIEDCGLMRLTGVVETPASFPQLELLDAGDLTVTTPDGTVVPLEFYDSFYTVDLGDEGFTPVSEPHHFSATGRELPPFEVDVSLVPEFQLETPDPQDGVPSGDTTVVWTGSSDATVRFEIGVFDEEQLGAAAIVSCEWEDDGEAVLPGTLLDGMPGTGLVVWEMGREWIEESTLSDGTVLGLVSSSGVSWFGY